MQDTKGFSFELLNKDNSLKFKINTQIYSLSAVYQAAYFFLDKVYVFLDGDPKKEILVIFKAKEGIEGEGGLSKIAGEFYNELMNQLLREKVSSTNAKIREYVVSQALYNAVPNEVDELLKEVEEEDWQEDAMGINKPWEDKEETGKKGGKSKKGKKINGSKKGKKGKSK